MDIDLSKIYDKRTREYLSEVLACYNAGSYRSAIVLLNSVCLSDLFYKLQELRDVYSDKKAKETIKKIEERIARDKTSPSWEKTLVETIFNDMHLLDSAGYTHLVHLHDYRNLTAHPVLDGSSELYQPSKALVESCICEAYNNILIKPSIFVQNIVNFMSDDLDSKKGYILLDKDGFAEYIEKKYFNHMSEAMIIKVFRAFWKFTYMNTDNDDCERNRKINHALIMLIAKKYKKIVEEDIISNNAHYGLSDHKDTVLLFFVLLSNHHTLYSNLSGEVKTLVGQKIQQDVFYKLVSWFITGSKTAHIEKLINDDVDFLPSDSARTNFLDRIFNETGEIDALLKYYVYVLSKASSFASVTSIMDNFILPNVQKMNKERLEDLINTINTNNQIYWNYNLNSFCGRVWKYAKNHFNKEYLVATYPNFKIPEQE